MKKLISCFLISLVAFTVSAQEYGWTDISANIPGSPDLSDVFFVSDNEGWISSSSQAEIYHTTDGGETFEVQTTQFATEAIYMIDENEGYAGGSQGRVYRTADGGDSWIAIGSIGATLIDIDFATSSKGYACGFSGQIHEITSSGVIGMTSNAGSVNLKSICFPDSTDGWVCGESLILHFDDENWNADQLYPTGSFNSICFTNNTLGWAVGDNGLIIHTVNGGTNWFTQVNSDPEENSLYTLFFLDENIGWTIGIQGTILKTTNGGNTWVLDEEGSTLAGSGFLRGVYFTSPNNGYVAGNGTTLLKFSEITSAGNEEISTEFLLLQNYPNPFNPETVISYQLSEESRITLSIYNTKGQLIKNLVDDIEPAGKHSIVWSGKNVNNEPVGSGIYFAKIKAGAQESVKRMILLK